MRIWIPKSEARLFLAVLTLLSFLYFVPGYCHGDDISSFPTRPVTFIQPFSAGASTDVVIRLVSKEAEKVLGQPIIIVNKPGASGTIGVAAIAAAKPDGYTIGNAPHSPMFVVPHLEKVPYHPAKDFKMIVQFGAFNMGVGVKYDSPFKSLKDLIDYARQNPKKLTYGSGGANSMQFIIMEQIAKKEKIQLTHIPYPSTGEAQTALLGGHILFAAGDFNYPLIEAKEIRLLAVFREESKEQYPDIPDIKELGYDLPAPMPMCVAGPKGIPDGIAKKIEDAYTKAVKSPAYVKGMKEDLHLPIVYRNSKDLGEYTAYNYEAYGKILKEMGLAK
jgi:tripartite-type tricarboxylate transporter receptor subunit TctC